MHLIRRVDYKIVSERVIILVAIAITALFIYIGYKYFVYRAKDLKKKASPNENTESYELNAYRQTTTSRNEGISHRIGNYPVNNNTSDEFCEPLPLYTPPSNSTQIQIELPEYNSTNNSPPYSNSQ